jgi:hypothetical protein
VRFDLSILPENTIIKRASLNLYAFAHGIKQGIASDPNNALKELHVQTSPWSEDGITWKNLPYFVKERISWSSNTTINTWEEYDITGTVQDMVLKKVENHGFLLKFPRDQGDINAGVRIFSSDYETAGLRPKLVIEATLSDVGIINNNFLQEKNIRAVFAEGRLFISTPGSERFTIDITNVQGKRVVKNVAVSSNTWFRLPGAVTAGVYIMRISRGATVAGILTFINSGNDR